MQNKKQLFSIVEDICRLNEKVWDNHAGDYEDETESAYQIEEALEGLDDLVYLGDHLESFEGTPTPKLLSRYIVDMATVGGIGDMELAEVDRFDKALDAIYFAIGSMHKLGLSPHQMVDGLQVVHMANMQKSGEKDANGKVSKPTGFIPPEDILQTILDKRSM